MKLLRSYLHSKDLTLAQASSFLRLVFLVLFMGQLIVAMLTGVVLRIAVPGSGQPGDPLLGWVLVFISLPHLPLVLYLSTRGVRALDRGSSLSATILAAVLLSTPAWFLSLALITGQQGLQLFLLLLILLLQYAVGMFLTGRFAKLVIPAARPPESEGAADAAPVDPA